MGDRAAANFASHPARYGGPRLVKFATAPPPLTSARVECGVKVRAKRGGTSRKPEAYFEYVEGFRRSDNEVWRSKLTPHVTGGNEDAAYAINCRDDDGDGAAGVPGACGRTGSDPRRADDAVDH